ncbi:MAG TPA: 4-alpha-glucanotransferase [Bryobacteraceae bacterium]|nr:4-alpha-glucanotransferase [Bryobacteraceae bacterium]
MHSENYEQLLDLAARLWRVDPEFWDIWGRHHVTSDETKRAILKALGVNAETAASLRESIEARRRKEWTRLAPPCLVVTENSPLELPLHATGDLAHATAYIEIREESGDRQHFDFELASFPECGAADVDGRRYVRKQVPLPANLPIGYHDVEVRLGSRSQLTRLIVAPARAYAHPALANGGKAAGIALALYGLRSARAWGCGDLRDLRSIVDWVAQDAEASFIALNPLHAIYNRRPYNTSPYLPECIFYPNYLYLDVEAIPDFQQSARAQRLWSNPETQRQLAALRASEFVEYEQVSACKLRFLKLAFLEFLREYRAGSPRAAEFRGFLGAEGDLLDRFATYCALDEYLHSRNPDLWTWPDWPGSYRDPDSAETLAFRKKHWRRVLFYCYVQWQLAVQLAGAQAYAREKGLSIGLYHDLALATDRFGADLWAQRPYFVSGCRVGSPPDDFAPKGQDWGFPPPFSEHHRENGYRLFTESIRKNCRHGGALRIDHVMRFFRLYWIPEGADATEGAYVRENYEDLVRILALESVRQKVIIIGEDLGTVEPFVRETLDRFGILSYRLFYFEKRPAGDFKTYREYPAHALVSSTTHDLPTLAGFWTGEDIEARRRAGLFPDTAMYQRQVAERTAEKQKMLDLLHGLSLLPDYVPRSAGLLPEITGDLHNAVIGFLALTPSQLLAVNQEDLTKEISQQNLPATTWRYPNWSRKMKYSLEQLRTEPAARDFVAMFRNWLIKSGRINRK